ncbi:MAG TPA: hypothetical protein VM940_07070 [Chthoniobacterales bacterium]|jgi:hypothetical protein|nr:hypothetical protein [Chthoniobacterales bacterium]
MITAGKRFLYLGLFFAVLFGILRARGSTAWLVPWLLTGGTGMICGLIYVKPQYLTTVFLSVIGLVVALSAILLQDYNPKWLSDIVFWFRVLFAHILLTFALSHLLKPGRDPVDAD